MSGIALFNASGQVLIGRRFRDDGPEIILPGLEWQMPQGGIDAEENPREAVMRELVGRDRREERRLSRRDRLADLRISAVMPGLVASACAISAASGRNGSRCAFTGRDEEIDPLTSRNGQPAEFDQWRWERLDRVADLVVPFRREVYRAVAEQFAKFSAIPAD